MTQTSARSDDPVCTVSQEIKLGRVGKSVDTISYPTKCNADNLKPTCGYRITAITPAFQAGDVGSTPTTRSMPLIIWAHFSTLPFFITLTTCVAVRVLSLYCFGCSGRKWPRFRIKREFRNFLLKNAKIYIKIIIRIKIEKEIKYDTTR